MRNVAITLKASTNENVAISLKLRQIVAITLKSSTNEERSYHPHLRHRSYYPEVRGKSSTNEERSYHPQVFDK